MRLVQLPTSISHKSKLCRCHSKSDLNCDDREKKQTRFQLYYFFATLERLYPQARPQSPNPLTYPPTLQPKPLAMQDPSQGLTFCKAQGHKVTATVLSGDPPRSTQGPPKVQRCPAMSTRPGVGNDDGAATSPCPVARTGWVRDSGHPDLRMERPS